MNPLNSIMVEGNLVRDPERRETPKGTPICAFAVASNRYFRQEDESRQEVSFFDVETWSDTAERCAKTLKKGRGVRVHGRLKQDRWDDAEGKPHNKIKIVAERVEFRPLFSGNGKEEDDSEASEEESAEALVEEELQPAEVF
jgi:single-strand DNA-binding protein